MAKDGSGYKYEFKMYMEGITVPFQSAMVVCTPNGVEMNIEVHPSDRLFDLKPKILIEVFYRDWIGTDRKFRLMGEGEFSGFAKFDDATGSRSVSLVCKDFRMAIRKTPAVMVYQPNDDDLFHTNLYTFYGLKRRMILKNKNVQKKSKETKKQDASKTDNTSTNQQTAGASTNPTSNSMDYAQAVQNQTAPPTPQAETPRESEKVVNTATRTWGGELNLYSFVTNLIAGTAVGNPQGYYLKGNNGRFMLDAFIRGLWTEAVSGTNYATYINSRIRADKRMIIPENQAGYRFFNDKYLNSFGGEVIAGGNMFSSVESVMMRMAAIFQAQPYSCSTPSMIPSHDVMSEEVNKFLTGQNSISFRYPYIINSCMILPPMSFTAPPNCNIIFPCMYSRLTWHHDYDSDVTRAWYRKVNIFDGESDGDQLTKEMRDVPNTLLNDKTNGYDNPPITIEERYKGITSVFGQVESKLAAKCTGDAFLDRVLADPDAYKSKLSKIFKQSDVSDILNTLKNSTDIDVDDVEKKRKQLEDKIKAAGVKVDKPSSSDVIDRHAIFKFLGSRFNGRVISVDGDFNPYIVSGFPGAVIADDNRKGFKTLRTLVGTVQMVKHTISASGLASTSVVMNTVRFANEPTDMDDMGNPIFVGSTDRKKAAINPSTMTYMDPTYFPSDGAPMHDIKNVMKTSKLYDYIPSSKVNLDPQTNTKVKWAKDILMVSREGFKKGKSNLCFMDKIYMPNQIPLFYSQIFRQSPKNHFMIGQYVEGSSTKYFAYDSIHEALDALMQRDELKNDYESAMKFVSRPVITEEEYFIYILGASFRRTNPNNRGKKVNPDIYSCNAESLKYRIQEDEWYGRPNRELDIPYFASKKQWQDYYSADYCRDVQEGKFSSIYEKKPKTPFSKERRESVDAYRQEALKYVNVAR